MLLLWLSMVCMIPFDMVRLDSNVVGDSGGSKVYKVQEKLSTAVAEVASACFNAV